METETVRKGLKFALVGFLVFEILAYFSGCDYYNSLYSGIIHFSVSLILWIVGGIVLSFWIDSRNK
ncbi:hypothetical protein [Membranihabitans marinus]|uniref:hypothetical protein n=1 Tax=Membranihabitans marinus TaxID=1227546 RepID=UPI001F1582BA|nr:hypothetical protein [Membranihabitans marinus]